MAEDKPSTETYRTALTDEEREAWAKRPRPDAIESVSKGFVIPEARKLFLPPSAELQGGMSHCGFKQVLLQERREFRNPKTGEPVELDCASLALMDISDSPVHQHSGEFKETYQICNGEGEMVLGGGVLAVQEGDLILIHSGIPHGLYATREAVRAILTFNPAIAPPDPRYARFRDEVVVHPRARELATKLPRTSRQEFIDRGLLVAKA